MKILGIKKGEKKFFGYLVSINRNKVILIIEGQEVAFKVGPNNWVPFFLANATYKNKEVANG